VTGIFRALPQRVNPRQRTVRSVFKTYLDVLHFQKTDKGRLSAEDASIAHGEFAALVQESSEERAALDVKRARMVAMSRDPSLYDHLAQSLAPSIWELDDVKKGVLLQLFGGVNKDMGRQGKVRGEINVLLCGDPGVSKSQLLAYVHKVAPRGIYTSGKGSSAVGLTAYITKDPDTKVRRNAVVLWPGATWRRVAWRRAARLLAVLSCHSSADAVVVVVWRG
jgi:DNA replication licensing factor MCM4